MKELIHTARTELRPLAPQDDEEIVEMRLKPESSRFIPPMANKSRAEILEWLVEKRQANAEADFPLIWTIRERGTGTFIGMANLNFSAIVNEMQVGGVIDTPQWGKGYATEVWGALLDYGFQEVGLPEIYAVSDAENTGSCRALEKIGMERIREYRDLAGDMLVIWVKRGQS